MTPTDAAASALLKLKNQKTAFSSPTSATSSTTKHEHQDELPLTSKDTQWPKHTQNETVLMGCRRKGEAKAVFHKLFEQAQEQGMTPTEAAASALLKLKIPKTSTFSS